MGVYSVNMLDVVKNYLILDKGNTNVEWSLLHKKITWTVERTLLSNETLLELRKAKEHTNIPEVAKEFAM